MRKIRTKKSLTHMRKREETATDVDREECGGKGKIIETQNSFVHTGRKEEITTTTVGGEGGEKEDEIRTRSDTYEETRRVSENNR